MRHPIPLSSYILAFEVVSIVGLPLLLLGTRWVAGLKIVAKAWGCALLLGILLQALAVNYERTYTFPMRWSLDVPDAIRSEIRRDPGVPNQTTVVFSRPALTDRSLGKHLCYQVMFSDELAKRLREMRREVVDVEYNVTFRFDTPIFYHSPRLKGDDRNTTMGTMGYMSQGYGTSAYTCFPGPGLFK